MHHALEALDARGFPTWREHRTPERILSWIDLEFGGTRSIDAAAGGIWVAHDAHGPVAFVAFDVRGLPYHWLRNWRQEDATAVLGPYGILERARGRGVMAALLHAAMYSLVERGYRRALVPAVDVAMVPYFAKTLDAWFVENVERERSERFRTVVLASGNGGNFEAVARAAEAGAVPLDIVQLIVNRPGAHASARAARLGIPAQTNAWVRSEEARETYDERVIAAIAAFEPRLVLLLGWMHVLPVTFVARFPEALNLHPAFLPLDPAAERVTMPDGATTAVFRGAHAFADALAAGTQWAGASVHRVGAAVDRGEIFARAPLPLARDAGVPELERRLHALEHVVTAEAIRNWSYRQP